MVRFVLDDDKVYKVVAESDDAIWVIDYDNPCAPKMVKQDGLVNLEEIPVPDDYMQESVVSRAIYDTAKKRLGILSAILSDNAYITNAALRQRAIAKIAQDARVSQKTLKRWYYSYLAYGERGLCPASKIKKSKTLPQEHEKKIASALSKYYYSPKKRSLKTTYEMMLLKYYRNEQRIIVPDHPTYGQFLYYYRKNRDVVRKLISREGIGEYQKNARPLLGKGDAGITTIGYFEIDATVADIYVVSRFDRKPIGRPVLYVAIDIASRMIAGIYVGFEESAEAVLTCLANAACDKVDFCKEHGISITADMWPSKGLPGTIYTDRGSDFASFRVKELCSTFNMEITTLPPYRPDLKGYVERAIGCIQERYILYVPMVYQNTAKFPTKDTPQSALDDLNISEVVNPDEGTFTYTSTISMDLWNDTFELPQDDTYMMPIEHISRILGWEFWTGDNVLKIVSDELDDTNPDNFVIDTNVREETCYDVGTGEEIACD